MLRALIFLGLFLLLAGAAVSCFGVKHEIAQIPPEQRAPSSRFGMTGAT